MARCDPELSLWIRWLRVGAQLPLEHVAAVLGRECSFIETYYEKHGRHLRFIPSGPPRRDRRPGPKRLISNRTGTRVRILQDLGYGPDQIATILAIDLDELTDFLSRLEPVRRATLRRPRERRRVPGHLRKPVGRPPGLRPARPPTELEGNVVAPLVDPTPPRRAWVGSTSFRESPGASLKLTPEQAVEVRRERAAGASMYELARRYKVARNTIYRVVNDSKEGV
jgi:Helix-turn-helix domain of resolvase